MTVDVDRHEQDYVGVAAGFERGRRIDGVDVAQNNRGLDLGAGPSLGPTRGRSAERAGDREKRGQDPNARAVPVEPGVTIATRLQYAHEYSARGRWQLKSPSAKAAARPRRSLPEKGYSPATAAPFVGAALDPR